METPAPSLVPTSERKHHKYGPSKLAYIQSCAAFRNHDGTTDAAEQGTFLHDLMEAMLKRVASKENKTTLEQMSGWVIQMNELTEEEIDYLRFACKRCDVFFAKNPTAVHSEINVQVHNSDASQELNHGYLDVLFIFGEVGILIDFKFGWEPVTAASQNLQGMNYALGCFQKFRTLNRIGVEFVQPKLNWTTSAVFQRTQMAEIYDRLAEVIEHAEYVQAQPMDAQKYMKPGNYCKYCQLAASCTVLANHRAQLVAIHSNLPVPVSFKGLELKTPEDIALARYWADIAETCVGEVKQRAFEFAEANGGSLSCTLPNGEIITYEVLERNADRSLGAAAEVAEALKDSVSKEEILGAAELAITKLEPIVKKAMVELAAASGQKLTKKAAWERATSTLEANGLLTRPDRKIRFLKLKKSAVKQIEN